jgi:hypothetical protein
MRRSLSTAVTLVAAVSVLAAAPAVAKSKPRPKPKPISGTWSFTDYTPDPTVDASSDETTHCDGKLPNGPLDANSHTITVSGRGLLTVTGTNTGDWAMEIKDRAGTPIAGSDGATPEVQEAATAELTKGTYTVVFCNVTGAPTATAKYLFVYG